MVFFDKKAKKATIKKIVRKKGVFLDVAFIAIPEQKAIVAKKSGWILKSMNLKLPSIIFYTEVYFPF